METGSTSTTNRLSKTMVAENNGNKLVRSSKPAGLFKVPNLHVLCMYLSVDFV